MSPCDRRRDGTPPSSEGQAADAVDDCPQFYDDWFIVSDVTDQRGPHREGWWVLERPQAALRAIRGLPQEQRCELIRGSRNWQVPIEDTLTFSANGVPVWWRGTPA